MNLLLWTLVVPLLTAAIGGLGGPRPFKATMAGGLALTFGLCLATANQFLEGGIPTAFGDALRVDGLSALVLVLCGFVGLLSGVYGIGYLRRNEARGLVTPRMRREFYGLIPAYVFAMLVSVSNSLGILWIAVELTTLASVFLITFHDRHLARSRMEISGAGQPRPRLCPAGDRAHVRVRARFARRRHGSPPVDAFHASGAGAPSLHAATRRRVCPHRLRDQGWSAPCTRGSPTRIVKRRRQPWC